MKVTLAVDRARLRIWHLQLAAGLESLFGAKISFRLADGPPLPSTIEVLLSLEHVIYRMPRSRPWSLADRRCVDEQQAIADLTIDLTVQGQAGQGRTMRLLYDGHPDEASIFVALLEHRAPRIEVEDVTRQEILNQGLPSIENTSSVSEGYEQVVARVADLLEGALQRPSPVPARPSSRNVMSGKSVADYTLRSLAFRAAQTLYHLCCWAPHWRVGWRMVQERDVWDRKSLEGPPWSSVPDPGLRFYADPFPFIHGGDLHVFVEDFDHCSEKAVISGTSLRCAWTGRSSKAGSGRAMAPFIPLSD